MLTAPSLPDTAEPFLLKPPSLRSLASTLGRGRQSLSQPLAAVSWLGCFIAAACLRLPSRPPTSSYETGCVCVCEGGAVSHSSDLIQLKLNLRVTNLSQRSPTRRRAPLSRMCVLPIDTVSPIASPPAAPGCRLTVSVGQPWGLACCPDPHPSSPVLWGETPYTCHSAVWMGLVSYRRGKAAEPDEAENPKQMEKTSGWVFRGSSMPRKIYDPF